VHATAAEIAYLCAAAGEYFATPIRPEDVVWSYSGVRPLVDDGASAAQAATRDYVLALDAPDGGAPLLSVFGGKITTYRKLAEAALAKLAAHLPLASGSWSSRAPLPGGDFPVEGTEALIAELRARYRFVGADHMARLVRAYGTRTRVLLGCATRAVDLGRRFGADLTEAEVRYLMAEEWAQTTEDVLWRRTKLGLRLAPAEVRDLDDFMAAARAQLDEAAE